MEVDKIKDIAHIYIVERYKQRVFVVVSRSSIYGKHLVAMAYREAVHLKMVLAIHYCGWSHVPGSVAYRST